MKEVIRIAVKIIHIVSMCGCGLAVVLGCVYEIVGHAKYEQMLATIGINNGFKKIWIYGAIVLGVFIITWLLKQKMFKE